MKTIEKPTWLTLYSIGAIGISALCVVPLLHVAPMMRTLMMLLIAAALYGAIAMWLSANSYALIMENTDDGDDGFYTIHWDVAGQPVEKTPVAEDSDTDTHPLAHQEAA